MGAIRVGGLKRKESPLQLVETSADEQTTLAYLRANAGPNNYNDRGLD